MKKIIAILLSVLFFVPSPVFAKKYHWDQTTQEIADYCDSSRYRINELCRLYMAYGIDKDLAWEDYQQSLRDPQFTEDWDKTPAQLIKEYDAVTKDITFLWDNNEEIKWTRIDRKLRDFITLGLTMSILVPVGGYVGSALVAADMPLAGSIAEIIPNASARISFRSMLRNVIPRLGKGVFYADIGMTMLVVEAYGLITTKAFYFVHQSEAELEQLLSLNKTYSKALKKKENIEILMGTHLTDVQKNEITEGADELDQVRSITRHIMNQTNEWEDSYKMRLYHENEIKTLYALKYLRAEMADLSYGLRFRTAVYDLASIFAKYPLEDRNEVRQIVEQAYDEYQRVKREETIKESEQELKRWGYTWKDVERGNVPPLSRTFQ